MPLTREEREEKIRPLAEVGLSTRKIAEITGIPQSTVVRDQKSINSGEHPILQPDQADQVDQTDTADQVVQPDPPKRRRFPLWPIVAVAIALLALAVAAGAGLWLRGDLPTHQPAGYAPVFEYQTPVYLCVGITIQGYVSDLAPAANGTCPKDWKMLVLQPGT